MTFKGTTVAYELNRLAGTKNLDAAGAANVWAGTHGLDLLGALNEFAGVKGLGLNGVCNVIANTYALEAAAALSQIAFPSSPGVYGDAYTDYF